MGRESTCGDEQRSRGEELVRTAETLLRALERADNLLSAERELGETELLALADHHHHFVAK